MVVGFWNGSDSEIAGISTGKPPACQMPRLTSSTLCLKWVWQGLMSLQVLMIAITGLPAYSLRWKPICEVRERCPNARMSLTPYQRCERRSSGFLRFWFMAPMLVAAQGRAPGRVGGGTGARGPTGKHHGDGLEAALGKTNNRSSRRPSLMALHDFPLAVRGPLAARQALR